MGDILAKEAAASASGLEAIDEEDDEDEREEVRSTLIVYAARGGGVEQLQ